MGGRNIIKSVIVCDVVGAVVVDWFSLESGAGFGSDYKKQPRADR